MRRVEINAVKVGMVLARDVPDFLGNIMFKAGDTLKTQHLKTMHQWGVKELFIQSEANATTRGPETRMMKLGGAKDALTVLENRFEGFVDQPLMKAIYEIQKDILQSRTEEGV